MVTGSVARGVDICTSTSIGSWQLRVPDPRGVFQVESVYASCPSSGSRNFLERAASWKTKLELADMTFFVFTDCREGRSAYGRERAREGKGWEGMERTTRQ